MTSTHDESKAPLATRGKWPNLSKVIDLEAAASESTWHQVQLCVSCRRRPYWKLFGCGTGPSSSTAEGLGLEINVGTLSNLLFQYDKCDMCLLFFRICQISLPDLVFERLSMSASSHPLSLVRAQFWKESILDQARDAREDTLLGGLAESIQRELPAPRLLDVVRLWCPLPEANSHLSSFMIWEQHLEHDHKFLRWKSPEQILSPEEHFDSNQVLGWLSRCERSHGGTCGSEYVSSHLAINLVDVETREICQLAQGQRFAALSYVWGNPNLCTSSRASAPNRLPSRACRTVEDAITVTRKLGIRFLWVDRYCIDKDASSATFQIRHMDEVYRHAYITIFALSGSSCEAGLPRISAPFENLLQPRLKSEFGVLTASPIPDPRETIQKSKWKTRGWTLQEAAMSRRRLGFLESVIFLECDDELFLDYIHDNSQSPPMLLQPCLRLDGVSYRNRIVHGHWNFDRYSALIEEYSTRELGIESDRLAALEGLLSFITKVKGVDFFCGHPIGDFAYSLLWHRASGPQPPGPQPPWPQPYRPARRRHTQRTRLRTRLNPQRLVQLLCQDRRDGFPSWSWAGWLGGMEFPLKVLYQHDRNGKRVFTARLGASVDESHFIEVLKPIVFGFGPALEDPLQLRTWVVTIPVAAKQLLPDSEDEGEVMTYFALLLKLKWCRPNGEIGDNTWRPLPGIREVKAPPSYYRRQLPHEKEKQHLEDLGCVTLVMAINRETSGKVTRIPNTFQLSPYLWACGEAREETLDLV